MNQALNDLARRIRSELKDLRQVVERARITWEHSKVSSDDYYIDAVALNLHGFYSGLERLFELIAVVVDDAKPAGSEWHQELLQQMSTELPSLRPAVLTQETREVLDEYRRFRHLVRNVYTFKLKPEKMSPLVENAPGLYQQINRELLAFADFLEQRADDSE